MTELAGAPPRRDAVAAGLATAGCAALALAVAVGGRGAVAAVVLGGASLSAAAVARRRVVPWEHALAAILLVILFIPINRYKIPGGLPFDLEPYRLVVALVLAGWAVSLLVDPRVTLRRTGLEGPIALILAAAVASIVLNPARVGALQPTVVKGFTFFLSFLAVLLLIVSVVRSERSALFLAKLLVLGGGLVGALAVVEARTGITPFTHLERVFPFLTLEPSTTEIVRGSTVRAFGPAEHPIALSAALVVLIPLAVYVVRASSVRWYVPLFALATGVLATGSRTGVIMLVVTALVFLALKPRETRRLWPLVLPLLVLTHFAAPGTLGSLRYSFQPAGGLVAQQSNTTGDCDSDGRVADLEPTLAEVAKKPLLGYGFGTRVTTGPEKNGCILDNQWLGTLVDVGVVGFVAWLWFFLAVIRRLGGLARADDSPASWLYAAVAASSAALAVGMLTFDGLGFTQVTFLLFVLIGLGTAVARSGGSVRRAEAPEHS
jgi:hypothetical protein